ncbi:hypothetical protein GR702_01930 [Novosphingobium sp. FGD1]|jgi:hypothetical protein|uniref:Uncharacterized protein n=1 Tax=Novosphingobium silvae TaxID=2692619 RepID=A0A7X4K5W7_9SPHN|nr:hypothetical protein [Novosphingobium silvae]MYL96534.1 hypothetical protein [Novosphingobium silvae]
MENLWAFVIIGGPIVLGLAILYGGISYWRRNRRLDPLSHQSAQKVREDVREEERRAN